MRRSTLVLIASFLLAGCAAAPQPVHVSTARLQAADELECVGKCLEFGDESCEACVDRCMETTAADAVAATTPRK